MPTAILMPALSPTMEEGSLSKWSIAVGDRISAGQVIAEIETDKATMEVEAVDEGVVVEILVPAGTENVKVNAPIAMLLQDDEAAVGAGAQREQGQGGASVGERTAPAKPAPALVQQAPASPKIERPVGAIGALPGSRLSASPLARRLAKIEGLDLRHVKGTGPHQRIVKRDIEAAIRSRDVVSASAPDGAAQTAAAISGIDARLYPVGSYRAIKLDGMRRVIAKRLTQSFNDEVPHFPLTIDIDLTKVLSVRTALNAAAPSEGQHAYKLSVNDFVIKASAMALMEAPHANASYTEEAILLHHHADIGVAVAIDGGLITPIIWKAEQKGLRQISAEVKELAARARARKLKPEEFQGGTFSVSNLGMFGVTSFASIVNQPQGAILSVGAGEDRAVVRDGQIVIRTMMTVTLTCDHRVVDGAVGAAFLAAFKRFLEEPATMLL